MTVKNVVINKSLYFQMDQELCQERFATEKSWRSYDYKYDCSYGYKSSLIYLSMFNLPAYNRSLRKSAYSKTQAEKLFAICCP